MEPRMNHVKMKQKYPIQVHVSHNNPILLVTIYKYQTGGNGESTQTTS